MIHSAIAAPSADPIRTNLPLQLSRFVGRVDAIIAVVKLLQSDRLVTLTGTGGAGKSRLAHRVAGEVADRYSDGVWWVELVGVSDPKEVVPAVAAAIGEQLGLADPLELLKRRLSDKRMLIVLDNCEHLVAEVAPIVLTLLSGCPTVSVLATSRAALALPGEVTWQIPPMSFPPVTESAAVVQLGDFDSVTLFVDRASRIRRTFQLNDGNAAAIAAICRRLDGIPLAIELAAARSYMLSPQRILAGLDDALAMLGLSHPRGVRPSHQTMEASIAWSYSLLNGHEQAVFRRLSVFRSAFSIEAVEAVLRDGPLEAENLLFVVARLVEQSLVQIDDPAAAVSFRLLETVRQFAQAQLAAADETKTVTRRHAEWFGAGAKGLWPLHHRRMAEYLDMAEEGHDDFIAALAWFEAYASSEELGEAAHGFLPALGHRHLREALNWFGRVIDHFGERTSPLLGQLLLRRAEMYNIAGRMSLATADRARAMAIGTALCDGSLVASVNAYEVFMQTMTGQPDADELCLEAARASEAVGNRHDAMHAAFARVFSMSIRGDLRGAERVLNEAMSYNAAHVGCPHCGANQRRALAGVYLSRGDIVAASAMHDRSQREQESLREEDLGAAIHGQRLSLECQRGGGKETLATVEALAARALEQGQGQAMLWLHEPLAVARYVHGHTSVARQNLTAAERPRWPYRLTEMAIHLAGLEHAGGDMAAAEAALATARCRNERFDNPQNAAQIDIRSAAIALDQHRISDATESAHRALAVASGHGYHRELVMALELLAAVAIACDDPIAAGRLIGAAERRRDELGLRLHLPPDRDRDERVAAESDPMGRTEGRAMTGKEAVAFATRSRGQRGRPTFGLEALTATERAVARHVGDGLTNPQIAVKLLMARETVKSHLRRIYSKLGVNNRVMLAALIGDLDRPEPATPG